MESTATTPIVVTGMHRSGTSLMASIVAAMGVEMGEKLFEADRFNPKGYFEDVDFLEFQKSLVRELTDSAPGWKDWGWTTGEKLEIEAIAEEWRDRARAAVERRSDRQIPWGWKDPRTSLLLDFWQDLLPEARYVFVYRFPWDVANSILRLHREPFASHPDYALQIWDFYNRRILDFYRRHRDRCLLVNTNAIFNRPGAFLNLFNDRLQASVPGLQPLTGDGLAERCEGDLLHSLPPTSPAVENLYLTGKSYFDLLAELDAAADLPSGFSTEAIARDSRSQKQIPIAASNNALEVRSDVAPVPTNAESPRVSVVIPCYNQGEYLLEAISSVQTTQGAIYETIVVNDASSDPLTQRVLDYLERKGYTVISHAQNQGLAAARNTGIRRAKGDYILPLDADNKIRSNYIPLAIEVLDRDSNVGVVYGNAEFFGDREGVWDVEDFDINSMAACNAIDACAVFRKIAWEQCGGYDPNIPGKLGYEDWDLWLGIARCGWQFHHLHEVVFDYRHRESSMVSGCNLPENRKTLFQYICAKHIDLYATNFATLYANKEAEALAVKNDNEAVYRKLQEAYEQLDKNRIELQKMADGLQTALDDRQEMAESVRRSYEDAQQLHQQLGEARAETHRIYEDARRTHDKLHQAEGKWLRAEQKSHQFEAQFGQAQAQLQEYQTHLQAALQQVQQSQAQVAALNHHISVMESTKFWKLRTLWFKLASPFSFVASKGRSLSRKVRYAWDLLRIKGSRYLLAKVFKKLYQRFDTTPLPSETLPELRCSQESYRQWLDRNYPRPRDLQEMAQTVSILSYKPTISIIVPVYNPPNRFCGRRSNRSSPRCIPIGNCVWPTTLPPNPTFARYSKNIWPKTAASRWSFVRKTAIFLALPILR